MVVIRLSRGGTKKRPFYNILVTDSRKPRDSGYIERLGFYNPIAKGGEVTLKIEDERLQYWLGCGAKPSERVAFLLKNRDQVAAKDVVAPKEFKKKAKAAKEEKPVEAPAAPAEQA
jgi:small subunit ribosomal protein S16